MITYYDYKRECVKNNVEPIPYYEWFEKQRQDFDIDYYKKNNIPENYAKQEQLERIKEERKLFDEDVKYAIKHHKRYLFHLTLGTILCMTVCFWLPFLAGFIKDFGMQNHGSPAGLKYNFVSGFASVCIWIYFTGIVSIPLSIIGSVTVWPLLLKNLMFEEYTDYEFHKDAYYPQILQMLKHGNIEVSNAIAVLASQIFW